MDKYKRTFVENVISRGIFKWRPWAQAWKKAETPGLFFKNGKPKKGWKCNICGELKLKKECEMDHIIPTKGNHAHEQTLDEFVDKKYCSIDNLQVLCKECHKEKSAKEKRLKS